jgi:hypothetical protein
MVAYEFYCDDPIKGCQLIGVLPERRKNPARITQESVLNWANKFFYKALDITNIFFIKITIDEDTGRIFRPTPFFVTHEKM